MAKQRTQRQREFARIHCLKKELDLDDETYRSMLWTVARVQSSSKLDSWGRQQVIEHMQARRGGSPREPKPGADRQPLTRKIRAQMYDLGVDDRYVDALARKVVGVERWTWATPEQMRKITSALWYAQQRQRKNGEKQ